MTQTYRPAYAAETPFQRTVNPPAERLNDGLNGRRSGSLTRIEIRNLPASRQLRRFYNQ